MVFFVVFTLPKRFSSTAMPRVSTRQTTEEKRKVKRLRYEMLRDNEEKQDIARKASKEARRRKKIEISLLNDEVLYWKQKTNKWKMAVRKLESQESIHLFKD